MSPRKMPVSAGFSPELLELCFSHSGGLSRLDITQAERLIAALGNELPAYDTIHTVEGQQVRTRKGEQVTIRVGESLVGVVSARDKDLLRVKLEEELLSLREHLAAEGGTV